MGDKVDKMNVGILVTIVSGFGKKGFYQSQEIGLGKELSNRGHIVTIYKCVPFDERTLVEKLNCNLRIKYIPVKKLGVHGKLNPKEIDENIDALLSFSDTQVFIQPIYKYCKKKSIVFIPYVGIAHSYQETIKSKMMDCLFKLTTLRIYKKCKVLTKTEAAKHELLEFGVKNITVTPVGLDETSLNKEFKTKNRTMLREQYGYSDNEVIICFVARLQSEKKPMEMLEIFNEIKNNKNFKLLIIGSGILKNAVVEYIENNRIDKLVKIIDKVEYDKMWEIYHISDYFVNLRAEEIFGMSVMEAVYYQTSVAAIDAPGPSTILSNMSGHKICNNYVEIEEWLNGTYPQKRRLEISSEKIVNRFTWRNCADELLKIIQEEKQCD